jgi:hypothetical protein
VNCPARIFALALFLVMPIARRAAAQETEDAAPITTLSALHDIVEPATVPWWPPALGWYVIGLLAVVLVVGWLVARRQRIIANRYRGAALRELDAIKAAPGRAPRLSSLVKRVALAAWPRAEVASQAGSAWWKFVDSAECGEAFSNEYGATLEHLAYGAADARPPGDAEVAAAVTGVEGWIRDHRVPAKD